MSEHAQCVAALRALIEHEDSAAFLQPVDPDALGIPTYFDVIKQPMDLSTISGKLRDSSYTKEDFVADVHLTFKNAMTFNMSDSPVYQAARRLLKMFDLQWAKAQHRVTDAAKAAKAKKQSADAAAMAITDAFVAKSFTQAEKQALVDRIVALDGEGLMSVVNCIRMYASAAQKVSDNNVDIDIGCLNDEQLTRLKECVDDVSSSRKG